MENPLVSVIIPTYNGQHYIEHSINSVLVQSYQNIEIIIINDGSGDTTSKLLHKLAGYDKRIIIINNKENAGFVRALRLGIERARGNYIARLDDDDQWIDKDKLKKQVNFLQSHPGYVLVGGGVVVVREVDHQEVVRYLLPEQDQDIRRSLLMYNVFSHSSVMFLKDVYEKSGGYNESFGFFADADLWLKMGTYGKLYNLQEYVIQYLDKEDSIKKYSARDKQIRRRLLARVVMKWHYRKQYPHIKKALLLSLGSFIYSFVPYKKSLKPFLFKIRTTFFTTPYKYSR